MMWVGVASWHRPDLASTDRIRRPEEGAAVYGDYETPITEAVTVNRLLRPDLTVTIERATDLNKTRCFLNSRRGYYVTPLSPTMFRNGNRYYDIYFTQDKFLGWETVMWYKYNENSSIDTLTYTFLILLVSNWFCFMFSTCLIKNVVFFALKSHTILQKNIIVFMWKFRSSFIS